MLIKEKISKYLAVALALIMLPWTGIILAANYQWIQSDWSGGETTTTTGHDPDQNGQTQWNKYTGKDANIDTSVSGQISLFPLSTSQTQTTDTDFNSGILTNLAIVGTGSAAYLKIKDYPTLDVGTGADGDLVIDGTNPNNSMENGIPLGQAYPAANPFIIDMAKNYRNITVQNGGSISASGGVPLASPSNVIISILSGTNGPDGNFYYVVTAVDPWGFQTVRSPSADSTSNFISVTGNNAPKITWTPVSGATEYLVYRRTSTASGYASPSLVCATATTECIDTKSTPDPKAPPISSIPQPSATYSTGGAIPAGTYYYALTAIDTWGFETTIGTQKTLIDVPNGSTVALSWTSVTGATGYRIYRTTMSGIYNSPALICSTAAPATMCTDNLNIPMSGAPRRSYNNALNNGLLRLKASGTLIVDSTSNISMTGKGFPGGTEYQASYGPGLPGYGPGAAGNWGAGAGYGTEGKNNDHPYFPGNIGYPYGDASLTNKYPGSGGASGASANTYGYWGGKGGNGGGTIWISAGVARVYGVVPANGNAGNPGVSSYTVERSSGGGGGGSGGSILIEGDSVTISGQISAIEGAGGLSGEPVRYYTTGGAGGLGRIRISAGSLASTGTINPAALIGQKGTYESPTFDLGAGGVDFSTINWSSTLPPGSSLKFQIATNKDNQTWNFVGPGGSSNTYYPANEPSCGSQTCPLYSGHDGDRYIKFRAFFESSSIRPEDSPVLDSITINYQFKPSLQSLISSPYDTTDPANSVRRWKWLEDLSQTGTDVVLQMRTSPNGASWGPWYGPHNTTFSAAPGVTIVTVADVSGFSVGSRVTLTNSANLSQEEVRKIIAIDTGNKRITLDSATSYTYAGGSTFSDTYTDPGGTEEVNLIHRDGIGDRWIQYRVLLSTESGLKTPVFLENRIGYLPASGIYQPDGVIQRLDGTWDGDNVYGAFGSGSGGAATRETDPGFRLQQPLTYGLRIQNDGTPESVNDTYALTWNTPSDASGTWSVLINDGISDLTSPASVNLNAGSEKTYTMKVTPSPNAPADSTQDIILNLWSENEYARGDSIKTTTRIKRAYQADGLIDNNGDNLYDPNRTGGGGTASKEGGPGDTVEYSIKLQNEGNISDTYTLSLQGPPPNGWTVLINDGSKDYDITNPSIGWSTLSIPPPPYSGSTVTYTLKVVPKGDPITKDIILNIYSNGGGSYSDSLTARLILRSVYKVDGVIYSYGYENVEIIGDSIGDDDGVCETGEKCAGEIKDYGVQGTGCGTAGPGDNIYGALSSGGGGCTSRDIAAGSSREITVGVQNEGNIPDRYQISWVPPSGWGIVVQERLSDGSIVEYSTSPVSVPTATAGNPSAYNGGEAPFFTFKITPPSTFTSGSQTVIFDIRSTGDAGKVDSVKAIINSGDTTPPASAILSLGNVTATSVKVSWSAPGDNGGSGTAKSYDLRYSTFAITNDNFARAGRVSGCQSGETILRQPKSGGSSESCTVIQLFANTDYYFALKTTDDAGYVSAISTCSSPSSCMVHTGSSSDTTAPGAITDLNTAYTRVIYPMSNPAFAATTHAVSLQWTAKADDGDTPSSGPATAYDIRYSTRKIVDDSATPGAGEMRFSEAKSVTVLLRFDTRGIAPVCLDGITDLAQLDQAFISNQGELLPPRYSGGAECYTVIVENRINTGGNIIDDRTQNTRFYFAVKALDERGRESSLNISSISNAAGGMTNLIPYAYNMVSVPYIPNPNTPADVFGDDVGTPLYAYSWKSSGSNVDNGCYDGVPVAYNPGTDSCTVLSVIKEGPGYFLWVPYGNHTIDVPSSSLPSSDSASYSTACDDGAGGTFPCYQLSLQEGWNMIGNPFDKEIGFSSMFVRNTVSSVIRSFPAAVTAGWTGSSIYIYNGINYTYETCNESECIPVLQPWKSYWIWVDSRDAYELLIPG